ncbi:MAG: hypothetical protein ACFFCI_02515 [Promethearchaeota archaeon]
MKKYQYLIFLLVYVIVSALLPFLFVGAISQNIGVDYWQVLGETYGLIFLAVLLGSAVILFALYLIAPRRTFEGKGGFIVLVVYALVVVIFGALIYYLLLTF